MRRLVWYFDVISPYAYLQHNQLKNLPTELEIERKPVLFAGLLDHWGHLGPAEIPKKRTFTYRYTCWLARKIGIPFRMPPAHPFNPLRALRLAVAAGATGPAVHEIFHVIWGLGQSLDDPAVWTKLVNRIGLENADQQIARDTVKEKLRQNTRDAVSAGVFGVPTSVIDEELFWGFDATDMLRDYVSNTDFFAEEEMRRIAETPVAAVRPKGRLATGPQPS